MCKWTTKDLELYCLYKYYKNDEGRCKRVSWFDNNDTLTKISKNKFKIMDSQSEDIKSDYISDSIDYDSDCEILVDKMLKYEQDYKHEINTFIYNSNTPASPLWWEKYDNTNWVEKAKMLMQHSHYYDIEEIMFDEELTKRLKILIHEPNKTEQAIAAKSIIYHILFYNI